MAQTEGTVAKWTGENGGTAVSTLSEDRRTVSVSFSFGVGIIIDPSAPDAVLDAANPIKTYSPPPVGPISGSSEYSATFYSDGLVHKVHVKATFADDPVVMTVDSDVADFAHP